MHWEQLYLLRAKIKGLQLESQTIRGRIKRAKTREEKLVLCERRLKIKKLQRANFLAYALLRYQNPFTLEHESNELPNYIEVTKILRTNSRFNHDSGLWNKTAFHDKEACVYPNKGSTIVEAIFYNINSLQRILEEERLVQDCIRKRIAAGIPVSRRGINHVEFRSVLLELKLAKQTEFKHNPVCYALDRALMIHFPLDYTDLLSEIEI